MTQPTSSQSTVITRQDLIKNFEMMKSFRNDHIRAYRHFIPLINPAELIKVSDPNPYFYPIYQCECSHAMDRGKRNTIEYKTLDKVESVFGKTKPLILYSLGSGNCYQELSFCVKLAEEGYDVRKVVLVDTEYKYGDQELTIVEFSKFSKLLFPNLQISVYKEESEYLEEIKNSKQQKPDIILCIDVERADLPPRQVTYSKMLESSSIQAVFAYHNHLSLFGSNSDACSVVDVIKGVII